MSTEDDLRSQLQSAQESLSAANERQKFSDDWWNHRVEHLRLEAERVGNWDRVSSILANGRTLDTRCPAGLRMHERVVAAEKELAAALARAEKAELEVKRADIDNERMATLCEFNLGRADRLAEKLTAALAQSEKDAATIAGLEAENKELRQLLAAAERNDEPSFRPRLEPKP